MEMQSTKSLGLLAAVQSGVIMHKLAVNLLLGDFLLIPPCLFNSELHEIHANLQFRHVLFHEKLIF